MRLKLMSPSALDMPGKQRCDKNQDSQLEWEWLLVIDEKTGTKDYFVWPDSKAQIVTLSVEQLHFLIEDFLFTG